MRNLGSEFCRTEQKERRNKTYEIFLLATILDLDVRFASLVEDLEGEVLNIGLHFGIVELSADETLCIEDTENINISNDRKLRLTRNSRVMGIHGDLILCSITD
jgi:hypothetical protein